MNAKALKARLITILAALPTNVIQTAGRISLIARPGSRPLLKVEIKPGHEIACARLERAMKKNGDPHVIVTTD